MAQRATPSWINRHSYHSAEQTVKYKKLDYRVCNFLLAVTSVSILQNAARKAKRDAEATLEAKVKRLQAITAESQAKNNANQAEKLLEEIRHLRRGAFVPIWENPILGAILLPSSGTAVFQMLFWLMGR